MYESYYRTQLRHRYKIPSHNHFTRYYFLRRDKHRIVKFREATGHVKTVQYPHLYPMTRRATDFEV